MFTFNSLILYLFRVIGALTCELMLIICGILFACDETSFTTVGFGFALNYSFLIAFN